MALTDNMIAWWQGFDNLDSTGSYDLVFKNGATTSTAGDNFCGSYFTFPQAPNNASFLQVGPDEWGASELMPFNSGIGFTMSMWVYNIDTNGGPTWLLKSPFSKPFYIEANGNIIFKEDCYGYSDRDTGYDLRSNLSSDTWHHLVMQISQTQFTAPFARYYLDGVLVAGVLMGGNCKPATGYIRWIGNEESGGGMYPAFERLTDIAVWDRVLTSSEIEVLSEKCLYDILNPPPEISTNAAAIDFGSVFQGETNSATLTVSNIGEGDLHITDIQLGPSKRFIRTGDLWVADTLSQNESRDIEIKYTPGMWVGSHTGHITISSNDENEPEKQVSFSGECLQAPQPEIDINTGVLDFGTVTGGDSETMTLTITNIGPGDLNITDIQLTSQHSFTKVTPGTEFSIVENATMDIDIEFEPQGNINFDPYLTIYSNDEDEPEIQIDLLGKWAKPPPPIITKDFKNKMPLVSARHVTNNFAKASNQRARRVAQVPFVIGTRTNIALRRGSDSDFE